MAAIDLLLEGRRIRHELPRRIPPPRQPNGPRLRYFRAARDFVRRARDELMAEIGPALARLEEEQREVRADESAPAELERALERMGQRIEELHRAFARGEAVKGIASQVQAQSLRDVARRIGIRIGDVTTGAAVDHFLAENRRLIKSLAQQPAREVQALVREGLGTGKRIEVIREEILERFTVSESRAELIARTETAKLKAQIDAERVKAVGITHYFWRTAGDSRVRASHAELEGKRVPYASPPSSVGHHPGEFPNCRCYAEPDTSTVVGTAVASEESAAA